MTSGIPSALETLRAKTDIIVEEIVISLMEALPPFSRMQEDFPDRLRALGREALGFLIQQISEGSMTPLPLRWGDLQAFELADILRAFQIGSEIAWKWIKRIWREEGLEPEESLRTAELLWEFYFTAAKSVAELYLRQQEGNMSRLNGLLNRIRSIQDRDLLLAKITEEACETLLFRRAVFFLFEHEILVPLSAYDRLDPTWREGIMKDKKQYPLSPMADSLEARASYESTVKVGKAGEGDKVAFIEPETGSCYVLLPLNPTGSSRGLLYLEAERTKPFFGKRDLELLSAYTDTVGMALENTRLYREVLARRRAMDHLMSRVNTAHEEERARIARELHDSVTQSLLKIIYSAGFALDFLKEDPHLAVEEIEEVQLRAKDCLRELRNIMGNLRPTSLDILGLKETITRYAEQFEEESDISTSVDLKGLASIPPSVELTVFRILQEELTNIRKHSKASSVKIKSENSEGDLILIVEDDGVGFDPVVMAKGHESGKHLGLMAMRERAELLGGELNIDSVPGMGTRITVRLPMISGGDG